MNTNTQPILAWKAPARMKPERTERWYLIGGVGIAMMIAYGIVTGSWMMSFTFALIAGLYFMTKNEPHHDHSIVVYDIGIEFDGTFKQWSDFKEFWILRAETYHELHIAAAKGWKSDLVIQTGETDPYAIISALGDYLPQVAHNKEKILDAIIRFCKL